MILFVAVPLINKFVHNEISKTLSSINYMSWCMMNTFLHQYKVLVADLYEVLMFIALLYTRIIFSMQNINMIYYYTNEHYYYSERPINTHYCKSYETKKHHLKLHSLNCNGQIKQKKNFHFVSVFSPHKC